MKSNKSKVALTVIAIALAIFALTQCKSKDVTAPETSPAVAPVEAKPAVVEKAPEPVAPKVAEPGPAAVKPAQKTEKTVPAPGLPPEHRPIF